MINNLLNLYGNEYFNYKPSNKNKKFRCRICGKWFIANRNHKNQCDKCIQEYKKSY